jgi:peptidoglycan/xylan/chitin deacetylase (PgdA/CDA1 family)
MARLVPFWLVPIAVLALLPWAASAAPRAMPTEAEQRAAVARVAALGVPIYEAGRQGKYVALTFDDGPGPYTSKVLDELRKYRFRATWFVNGKNLARWGDTVRREAREGAVGDHTWSHPYLPDLPVGRQISEVSRSAAAVARITGTDITLFRPPYGSTTRELGAWMQRRGMLSVLWSTDSRDSLGARREEILRLSKQGVRPGAIILLHENRGQTFWAVNRLLPWIKKQGYTAVTVTELLALNPPNLKTVRARAGSGVGFR